MSLAALPGRSIGASRHPFRRGRVVWWRVFIVALPVLFLAVAQPALAQSVREASSPSSDIASSVADEDLDEVVPIRVGSGGAPAGDGKGSVGAIPGSSVDRAGDTQQNAASAVKLPGVAWGIPPVSWRASYGASYSYSASPRSSATTNLAQNLSFSANSYIYQPWFATVNGGFNLALQEGRSGGAKSNGFGQGFSLGANFLPRTRFNTSANLSQSENTSWSGSRSTTYTTTGVRLMQTYQPPSGAFRSNASLDHNQISSDVLGSDVVEGVSVNVAVPLTTESPQSLSFSGGLTRNQTSRAVGASSFSNFAANHSIYLEDYVFTLNSDFTYNNNELQQANSATNSTLVQMGGSFDWLPSDDYPVTVRGALRTLALSTEAQQGQSGQGNKIVSYFGNAQASYPLDKNWNFGVGVNGAITGASSAGVQTQASYLSLNANGGWSGDGYQSKLGEFDYAVNYGAGSGFSWNQTDARSDHSLSLTGNLGHSLARSIDVSGRPLSLGLGQSVGVSKSLTSDWTGGLAHSASMSWTVAAGPRGSLVSSAQFSDSRSLGQSESFQQSLNASLFGNRVMSAFSTLGSNIALGFTRQGVAAASGTANGSGSGAVDSAWQGYGSGSVTYSHARFAEVTGLNYVLTYLMNVRQSAQRAVGDASASPYAVDHMLNQRWNWRLGLLGWQIDNTFNYSGNALSYGVSLGVTRDFGGML